MAVLNKDTFFSKLHERVGTDTSEESLSFLEDMSDTYNDLESRANGDGVDWEKKYNELDASWRARYRHRFFSGDAGTPNTNNPDHNTEEYDPENVGFDDLFSK